MGAIRRHRTLFACIAIAAVLVNLAAGLFAPAFARGAASDPWLVELLGPQVICSEHGDQTALPGESLPPTPALHCLLCLAAPGFAFIVALTAAVLLPPPPIAAEHFALQFRDILADRLRRAGLGSRAPPLPG
jgi:hypothetical protein